MIYLVYASKATRSFSTTELMGLLRESRESNQREGVTGLLLYHNGQFMQLLEGSEEAVMRRYEQICSDPHHTDILKLVKKRTSSRSFKEWSMAFRRGEEPCVDKKPAGFSSFLNEPFSVQSLGQQLHEGAFLLLSFKKQTQMC